MSSELLTRSSKLLPPAPEGLDPAAARAWAPQLAAGIEELEELSATIATKLASDAKEEADEAVHAAGHLIEDLRGLLDKETLTTEAKEAGTKALDEIYECFDKLDVAFHEEAKEGAESLAEVHTAIASRFADAIKALKERFATEEK